MCICVCVYVYMCTCVHVLRFHDMEEKEKEGEEEEEEVKFMMGRKFVKQIERSARHSPVNTVGRNISLCLVSIYLRRRH